MDKNNDNGDPEPTMTNSSDDIAPKRTVEPIKITIPISNGLETSSGRSSSGVVSPTISVQNLNLSEQPTVAAQIGDKKFVNVKIVTPASLITSTPTKSTIPQMMADSSTEETAKRFTPTTTPIEKVIKAKDTMQGMENESMMTMIGDDDSNISAKLSRDLKQLQDSINNSKVLTEYFIEGNRSRSRRKSIAGASEKSLSPPPDSRSPSRSTRSVSRTPSRTLSRGGNFQAGAERSPSPSSARSVRSRRGSRSKSREPRGQKRSNMRSSNRDFIQKQQKFLQKVNSQAESDNSSGGEDDIDQHSSRNQTIEVQELLQAPPKPGWDRFCWRCYGTNPTIACAKCVRSYHDKCLKANQAPPAPGNANKWKCPECVEVELNEKS